MAGVVRLLAALFALLPWGVAQRAGRAVGRLGWRVARRERRRALEHLALAFPERAEDERRRIARASFLHLGTVLGEMLWLFTRDCDALERHLRVEGLERVQELHREGRPLLLFTGHCGNWEMLASLVNCRGVPTAVVARALDEAPLQRLLLAARNRFGTRVIDRGGSGAARELLRAMRTGVLGMLIDQDTRVEGVWVPFFGRPAYTPLGAARLALRRGVVTIPAFIERLPDGSHHARFLEPLELPDDEVAATERMTRCIEDHIRRRPEQWVWMHRRWRRRPAAGTDPAAGSDLGETGR
jgi:KDO2-lipid IV(A) lauroyltransferase